MVFSIPLQFFTFTLFTLRAVTSSPSPLKCALLSNLQTRRALSSIQVACDRRMLGKIALDVDA